MCFRGNGRDHLIFVNVSSSLVRPRNVIDNSRCVTSSTGAKAMLSRRLSSNSNAMRASLRDRVEERRQEIRPQIVAQLSLESSSRRTGSAAESPVVLRLRRALLAKQLEQAQTDYEKVSAEVKLLGNANADLMEP